MEVWRPPLHSPGWWSASCGLVILVGWQGVLGCRGCLALSPLAPWCSFRHAGWRGVCSGLAVASGCGADWRGGGRECGPWTVGVWLRFWGTLRPLPFRLRLHACVLSPLRVSCGASAAPDRAVNLGAGAVQVLGSAVAAAAAAGGASAVVAAVAAAAGASSGCPAAAAAACAGCPVAVAADCAVAAGRASAACSSGSAGKVLTAPSAASRIRSCPAGPWLAWLRAESAVGVGTWLLEQPCLSGRK